jgi:putative thioredoxin
MEQLLKTPPAGPPAGAPSAGPVIKDGTTDSFLVDVIEASNQVPVIVDFWATWCGPCKQLGPALEKAVREAKGAVRLVKIDVDHNQELAAQMRVQSIPAVYAFDKGRPVDGFVGALAESQIKAFVGRLLKSAGGPAEPSPIDQALEQADQALVAGDGGTASAIYGQVLAHEPQNAAAIGGLARCYAAAGDVEQAKATLAKAPADGVPHAAIVAARAAVELAEQGAGAAGAIPELRERLARDAGDHRARFDLALALYAKGEREAAVDELLEIVRRARQWDEEAGRKQLVKLFEAMGPTDPLTVSGRRRLSSLLFA